MDARTWRRWRPLVSIVAFPLVFYYLSPVMILAAASMGIVGGSLLMFLVLFATGLVLGRAWCGWLCPAGGLQEGLRKVRDRPARGGRWDMAKWAIWFPWLAMIVVLFVRAGGISGVDPLFGTWHGISLSGPESFIALGIVLGITVAMALLAGRRGLCRYVCWMAPFMMLGRKVGARLGLPALRLGADGSRCAQCGRCSRECPMSLDVRGMVREGRMESPECVLCGACADACPKGVLSLKLGSASGDAEQADGPARCGME